MSGLLDLPRSRLTGLGAQLAGVALAVLVISALGSRSGSVPPYALGAAVAVALVIALVAVGLAGAGVVDIWRTGRPGKRGALFSLALAAVPLAILALSLTGTVLYPAVHEVSTNLRDPPQFWSSSAGHPDEIGPEVASAMQGPYAGLAPRAYDLDAVTIFEMVMEIVEDRGWQVDLILPPETGNSVGKVEVTVTTPVFAFPDDVVVRVNGLQGRTRVDIRSASRFGQHDLGTNARRARAFLADLDAAVDAYEPPAPPADEDVLGVAPGT